MAFNHQSIGWMSIEWQYVLIHKLIGFWEVLVTVSVFRTISDKSRDIMFPWAIWCEYPDAECFIDRLFVKVRIEGIDFLASAQSEDGLLVPTAMPSNTYSSFGILHIEGFCYYYALCICTKLVQERFIGAPCSCQRSSPLGTYSGERWHSNPPQLIWSISLTISKCSLILIHKDN